MSEDCEHTHVRLNDRYADVDEACVTCPGTCRDCGADVEFIYRRDEVIEQ